MGLLLLSIRLRFSGVLLTEKYRVEGPQWVSPRFLVIEVFAKNQKKDGGILKKDHFIER